MEEIVKLLLSAQKDMINKSYVTAQEAIAIALDEIAKIEDANV